MESARSARFLFVSGAREQRVHQTNAQRDSHKVFIRKEFQMSLSNLFSVITASFGLPRPPPQPRISQRTEEKKEDGLR